MPKTILVPVRGDFVTHRDDDGRWYAHGDILAVYSNNSVWVEWWDTKERETIPFPFLEWDDNKNTWRDTREQR